MPATTNGAPISTSNKSRGQLKRLKKKQKGGAKQANEEDKVDDERPIEKPAQPLHVRCIPSEISRRNNWTELVPPIAIGGGEGRCQVGRWTRFEWCSSKGIRGCIQAFPSTRSSQGEYSKRLHFDPSAMSSAEISSHRLRTRPTSLETTKERLFIQTTSYHPKMTKPNNKKYRNGNNAR